MIKKRKEMQEVDVEDYYAEVGDVITIPGEAGEFVVTEARMTGGGSAQAGDIYPDAWHVKASLLVRRQLNDETVEVEFTQHTNCYNDVIEGVEKIGKMEKIVRFQWVN